MDPISIAQLALEKFLKESAGVKSAMKQAIKNIAAFNKLRGTELPTVHSENDLPEIRLEPVGGPSNINLASNAASLDWRWRLIVNTGDLRINELVAPICFALFAASAAAVDSSLDGQLTGLQWKGYAFAKNLSFSNIQTGQSEPMANRGILGWSAICDLTMHMIFPRTDLIDFNRTGNHAAA